MIPFSRPARVHPRSHLLPKDSKLAERRLDASSSQISESTPCEAVARMIESRTSVTILRYWLSVTMMCALSRNVLMLLAPL